MKGIQQLIKDLLEKDSGFSEKYQHVFYSALLNGVLIPDAIQNREAYFTLEDDHCAQVMLDFHALCSRCEDSVMGYRYDDCASALNALMKEQAAIYDGYYPVPMQCKILSHITSSGLHLSWQDELGFSNTTHPALGDELGTNVEIIDQIFGEGKDYRLVLPGESTQLAAQMEKDPTLIIIDTAQMSPSRLASQLGYQRLMACVDAQAEDTRLKLLTGLWQQQMQHPAAHFEWLAPVLLMALAQSMDLAVAYCRGEGVDQVWFNQCALDALNWTLTTYLEAGETDLDALSQLLKSHAYFDLIAMMYLREEGLLLGYPIYFGAWGVQLTGAFQGMSLSPVVAQLIDALEERMSFVGYRDKDALLWLSEQHGGESWSSYQQKREFLKFKVAYYLEKVANTHYLDEAPTDVWVQALLSRLVVKYKSYINLTQLSDYAEANDSDYHDALTVFLNVNPVSEDDGLIGGGISALSVLEEKQTSQINFAKVVFSTQGLLDNPSEQIVFSSLLARMLGEKPRDILIKQGKLLPKQQRLERLDQCLLQDLYDPKTALGLSLRIYMDARHPAGESGIDQLYQDVAFWFTEGGKAQQLVENDEFVDAARRDALISEKVKQA